MGQVPELVERFTATAKRSVFIPVLAKLTPIALRFISEMGQNPELAGMHLSGMGGIETWLDALEFILLGCGRCFVSCRDGGHQAITFGEDRKPYLNPKKCVGCHLCVLVCPQGAITSGQRRIKKNGDDT